MIKSLTCACAPGESVREKFENIKKAGFDGVEVDTSIDDAARKEIKELAAEIGLKIIGVVSSSNWAYPMSSSDDAIIEKAVELMKRSIDDCIYYGCNTVLLVPGIVSSDVTYETAMVNSKANIQKVISYAEEKKVYICLENVWNKFLLSPIEFKEFIISFNCEYVKAYFDIGNIQLYGYPQHWIKSLGSLIKKIHIKGFHTPTRNFVPMCDSDIDFKACMEALKEIGYDDSINAELGPDDRGLVGILEDLNAIMN